MPIRRALDRIVSRLLHPSLRAADADSLARARLCVAYNLTMPIWALGFATLLWAFHEPVLAAVIAGSVVCVIVPLVALRVTASLAFAGHMMAATSGLVIAACAWLEGGLDSPGIVWFPIVPVMAVLLAGRRAGLAWALAMVAILTAFYLLESNGVHPPRFLDGPPLLFLRFSLAAAGTVLVLVLGAIFESLKADALASLRAANEELARARDRAQAAARAKSDFLAAMSHEIRTPLHGIFGMTDLAIDVKDDGRRREFMLRVRACAETLLTIINDVLDFSRIDAGKVQLEHVEFDVRDVVEGVLDTLAVEASRKGVELVGCVGSGTPSRLRGDPARLRQILINLAGNALKFTERGEVVIHLDAVPVDDIRPPSVLLRGSVRDSGIGIPRSKQQAIFEVFTQGDTSTTRQYGGTGLGLPITKRLVVLMGGSIGLESALGRGSVFRFTARLEVVAPPAAPLALPGAPRVLVVDGNQASRRHLMHTLAAAGCRPTAVADVGPAVSETVAVDAIVVNVASPGSEGPELLARVRELPTAVGARVVALVPCDCGGPLRARLAVAATLVSKPVKPTTLLAALASAPGATVPDAAQPA
jgi:signal transduction histidine kinase/CheY-like chemotaxis protein